MTSQNRWLFDFEDILQVHFVCANCKAALSVPPRKVTRVPPQCVNCSQSLYATQPEQEALQNLAKALDAMSGVKFAHLKVRLEFDSPHVESISGN